MKKLTAKIAAILCNAKLLANHTAIKGKKSGGVRDSNGKDWRKESGGDRES